MHRTVKHSAAQHAYSALICCALAACASQPASVQPTTPEPRESAAAAGWQPSAAGEDLRGTWVEYWSVSGAADTDRFAFDERGNFDWHASAKAQSHTPSAIEKAGAFRVERAGKASVLVLEVQRERFAACASPCAESGPPREVQHSAPIIERYELGECPVNPEAERIDADYTCRAIGGKAFWRKKPDAVTPSS
jgi:hypothetical protein